MANKIAADRDMINDQIRARNRERESGMHAFSPTLTADPSQLADYGQPVDHSPTSAASQDQPALNQPATTRSGIAPIGCDFHNLSNSNVYIIPDDTM